MSATYRRLLVPALLCVFLALALAPASIWAAPPTVLANAKLPSPRASSTAVTANDVIYVFGGEVDGGYTGQVLRFEPSANTISTRTAAVDPALGGAAAGWDGNRIYLFGGTSKTCPGGIACATDKIQRYDPASDVMSTITSTLPLAADGLAVVWTGRYFFLFGPTTTDPAGAKVVRFDPVKDSVYTTGYALPDHRSHAAAIWDGTDAYIFGGNDAGVGKKTILKFHASNGQLTTIADTLPTERHGMGALWDGQAAYLLGGFDQTTPDLENGIGVVGELDEIVRFDPSSADAALLSEKLPAPRSATGSAASGPNGYLFGGFSGGYSDQILEYGVASNSPPRASIQLTMDGRTVTVDGRGSNDAEGPMATYLWDWGDRTNPSTGAQDSHTYADDETYTIRLHVTDSDGLAGGASRTVNLAEGTSSSWATTITTATTTTTSAASTTTTATTTSTTRSGTTTSSTGATTTTSGLQDHGEAGDDDNDPAASPTSSSSIQATESASWTPIEEQDDGASTIPALGALGVLAAMAAIAHVRRRRR